MWVRALCPCVMSISHRHGTIPGHLATEMLGCLSQYNSAHQDNTVDVIPHLYAPVPLVSPVRQHFTFLPVFLVGHTFHENIANIHGSSRPNTRFGIWNEWMTSAFPILTMPWSQSGSWSCTSSMIETTDLLTVMAGGAHVARVTAVTMESRPRLGTAASVFTVVWQTPNRR